VLVLGGLGWLAVAAIGGGNRSDQAVQGSTLSSTLVYRTVTRTTATGTVETVIAVPKPFHIVFPEGFTRKQMAERVAAVAKIAARKRKVRPKLSRAAYLAVTAKPRVPSCFRAKVTTIEGFLFPATTSSSRTDLGAARAGPADASARTGNRSISATRAPRT
jgi:hypothetical protein